MTEGFTTAAASGSSAAADTASGSANLLSSLEDILKAMQTSAAPESFKYIEDKKLIPSNSTLSIYLSSFSDKTLYDTNQDVYVSASQRWNNYLKDNEYFFLSGNASVPASIKPPHGLPLKNFTLKGFRSDQLNPTDFKLTSFSASFFLKLNTLTEKASLLKIYLETPNELNILVEPVNTTSVKFTLQAGNGTHICALEKPNEAILNKNVLVSMVYDETNSKMHLFVDDLEPKECAITTKPTLILGNTEINLNMDGKLDANMYAFLFYKSALTLESHKELKVYLEKQMTGINNILTSLATMTQSQIEVIKSYLDDQTITLEDLKKQLETCKAKAQTLEAEAPFKYAIKMDGTSTVTKEDLEQCSILEIKSRKPSLKVETPSGASATAASDTKNPFRFFINVPFLKDVIAKKYE